jgi:steroid delta-isomerase-like uncharacterized protein
VDTQTSGLATTTKPADVARAFIEALAKRDVDAAMDYVDEQCVDDFVAVGLFEGRLAIRRFFDEMIAAFPDFEIAADAIVADRSKAVVQWHAAGTFTGGSFQGVEPTGRHVELRGVDVMEIAKGHVHHNTIYYDGASFARQIGLLPRAQSTADRTIMSTFNAVTRLRGAMRRSASPEREGQH